MAKIDGTNGNDTLPGTQFADEIHGDDGNDVIYGFGGDDTINGGKGDDLISGGEGDDVLLGGTGNDIIYTGEGDDTVTGGKGDDLVYVGMDGGGSNNVFGGNGTGNGTGSSYGTGGTGTGSGSATFSDCDVLYVEGTVDILLEGNVYTLNAGDSLDLTKLGLSKGGTDGVVTMADGTTVKFDEIERIEAKAAIDDPNNGAAPNNAPGPVDGLETGENMPIGYTDLQGDMIDGTDGLDDTIFGNGGDDTIDAGLGNDTVEGGAGNDVIDGNEGDDLIYGDVAPGPGTVRESFEWNQAPDPNGGDPIDDGDDLSGGFSQDTGNVTVTFTEVNATSQIVTAFADNDQNVAGIAGDGDPVDANSSLASGANANGDRAEYSLDFSDEVSNVSFRVNDIDGDGIVSIRAFDAAGNPITVNLTGGSNLTLQDLDGVAGAETADSQGGYLPDTSDEYSILVEIPGPVARIVIEHSQDGGHDTGVNVTDIYFDATVTDPVISGNDEIFGGLGDDTVFGGGGEDTITGGDGMDLLLGEDDRDTFIGGNDGDSVDGGSGGDDFDTLDLRGQGPVQILNETPDADGNSTSGTIRFGNGDMMEFHEIERILSDPRTPGPVDGLDSGEAMGPGYTDLQGDMIDGSDGDDDTIFGNGGDDTIDSGVGDDTVDGGAGDDVFDINDEGNGIDNDVIIGGETDETRGDTIDTSGITDDLLLDISAPEEGTLTDGTDTTEFEEIEQFVLGAGDDTVQGSDGDDIVDAGNGNNEMDGGDGDDLLTAGGGDDTITGGDGNDTVNGGNGNNVINTAGSSPRPDIDYPGLYSADTDPNNDRDFVTTGDGNDHITTGDDADTISSGDGNDTINAGIDDDVIDAGRGDDVVTAGEGNDTVLGGMGNDIIYGGLGPGFPDAINIADDGSDPIGPDLRPNNGRDYIDGGRGNDLIYGEDDDDTLIGGNGADTLFGGKDDDVIDGGIGQDDIIGGQGMDSMFGGADRDEFFIDAREDAFGDTVDGGTDGNDVDTLDLRGLGRFEIVGETVDADGDSTSGTINFLDADGNVEGTLIFREIERLIPCFTPGTLIGTPRGEVKVEDLREGDRVVTRDNGVQEIRWVGKAQVDRAELMASPSKQPVLVRQGALGRGLPERDMLLSPNHKLLVANEQSALMFEDREVLAAAKHLTHIPGITRVQASGVTYIHFMFDHHEVVLSDGTWSESFQPGDYSLAGIDRDQREEIFSLFPELRDQKGLAAYGAARNTLKRHEAELLSF